MQRNDKDAFLDMLIDHINDAIDNVKKDIQGKSHNYIDCLARMREEHTQHGSYELGTTGRLFDDPTLGKATLEKMPSTKEMMQRHPYLQQLHQNAAAMFEKKIMPILQSRWKKNPPLEQSGEYGNEVKINGEFSEQLKGLVEAFISPLRDDPRFDQIAEDLARNSLANLQGLDEGNLKNKAFDLALDFEKGIYKDVMLQALAFKLVNPMVLEYSMDDKFQINSKKSGVENSVAWQMMRKATSSVTNNYHAPMSQAKAPPGKSQSDPTPQSETKLSQGRKTSLPSNEAAKRTIMAGKYKKAGEAVRRKPSKPKAEEKTADAKNDDQHVTPRGPGGRGN